MNPYNVNLTKSVVSPEVFLLEQIRGLKVAFPALGLYNCLSDVSIFIFMPLFTSRPLPPFGPDFYKGLFMFCIKPP